MMSRVFRAKIEELKDDLVTKRLFGDVAAMCLQLSIRNVAFLMCIG